MPEKHPFVAAQERVAAVLASAPDARTLSEQDKAREEQAFIEAARRLGYSVPTKEESK